MKNNSLKMLYSLIFPVLLLLGSACTGVFAQNASEARVIKSLTHEEKLARWNSFSEQQKEAIRKKARAMSEKKFKQLESNFERIKTFEPAEQIRVKENFGRIQQFKPQQKEFLQKRFEKFQQLPAQQRQQIRRQFMPQFQRQPGQQPGFKPEHRPGQQPGFKPQHRPDQQPGQQPGFKPQHRPDQQPGQQPGFKPQHRPGQQPGQQPGFKPQHRPGQQPGQQPGFKPQHRPDQQPGQQPGFKPQHRPDQQPGQQPGFMPQHRPGQQPGQQPGFKPQHRPDQQPGQQPGFMPQHRPGQQPGEQPGFKPQHRPDKQPPEREMRDFRNDMMGDKNRGPGQDEYRQRWRDIDNYRDEFGRPAHGRDRPDQTRPTVSPDGSGQPPRHPGINGKNNDFGAPEMRRPQHHDRKPMPETGDRLKKPGVPRQLPVPPKSPGTTGQNRPPSPRPPPINKP
ncbi:MAG TPA: hypothetical protein DCG57_16045 [Candidatus Riflebacteria bacterium]|nr:hypothetical protein [Candidatus Riflebacteria bacterium]